MTWLQFYQLFYIQLNTPNHQAIVDLGDLAPKLASCHTLKRTFSIPPVL